MGRARLSISSESENLEICFLLEKSPDDRAPLLASGTGYEECFGHVGLDGPIDRFPRKVLSGVRESCGFVEKWLIVPIDLDSGYVCICTWLKSPYNSSKGEPGLYNVLLCDFMMLTSISQGL